jgi:O-antigen ligase
MLRIPPPLALCLFVLFIAWLWRRYKKEAGALTPALWLPLIWVSINGSRPLVYWFAGSIQEAMENQQYADSTIDRNVYLVLLFLGIAVLARRRINWPALVSRTRWVWIFYLYLLISTTWSDAPWIALKRWSKDAGDIVMILIILTEEDPVEALRGVFIRWTYLLVPLSILCIKWYPTIGRYTHRWTYTQGFCGVTGSKNGLGEVAMLGGLFLLWQIVDVYRSRGRRLSFRTCGPESVVLLMCLWILSIAESATASFCFVLGSVVFLAIRLRTVQLKLGWLGACVLGMGLLMILFTVSPEFRGAVAGFLNRDITLTNRTDIWERCMDLKTNPLLGAGFSSVWLSSEGRELSEEWHLAHSHNGYLETYLNSGIIGVFLLLLLLLSTGRNAARQVWSGASLGNIFMAVFVGALFYNYTEVAFNRSNVLGFVLWVIALQFDPLPEASMLRESTTFDSSEPSFEASQP